MAPNSKIAVIGSTNWDICLYLPTLPAPGETVGGGELKSNLGGKGANQAVAAHLAGATTTFISCIGDDGSGNDILARFNTLDLATHGITQIQNTPTGTACIFIDAAGENCIGLTAGANEALSKGLIDSQLDQINDACVVVLQLEIPMDSVVHAATLASRQQQTVILNPAPAQALPEALFKHITIITPNLSELATITGMPTDTPEAINSAAAALLQKGVDTVVVTLGGEGAMLVTPSRAQLFPAQSVTVVDTTAAGDCFNGYLAAHLATHGLTDIDAGIETAIRASAIAVSRPGAVASLPTADEVKASTG
ncbi:ribokinase [Halioglobus japonicus]|uniref:Ribokinase n=1 Tax=Halioglobus japonicus TaxID=930805 RepID=A0AAP8MEA3_9GAMM|nr:ribokinase [Halioglobus japonicus]AQA18210.1 ribokinase [Halioglobus japonicus]PLW86217.1 ribokinase [Halioglobus japonicus]GHD13879.1 ribokinase [Halioglobus japonicus]